MKKKRFILIPIIIIIAGTLAASGLLKKKADPDRIMVSGNIEVTDIRLGFKISGRVETCFVHEGDPVSKGDKIATLESQDQKVAVDMARAGLERAKFLLAELEAGSRTQEIELAAAGVRQARQKLLELTRGSRTQDIESAKAGLEAALASAKAARSQLDQAASDYARFSRLVKEKSVSQRDFELYSTRYEVARNTMAEADSRVNTAQQTLSLLQEGPRKEQIGQARASLARAEAEYNLVKAGPRKEKIEQARAQMQEAEASLAKAEHQLSYTIIYSPIDGVVLTRSAEPGEFINPSQPVVTLADVRHPWLRAFVTEKALGKIKLGDTAGVTTDSFPGKTFQGRLGYISSQAEFTPKSVQTFEERVKLMFRIKIQLPNPKEELKPGMPADAVIDISGR